MSRVLKLIPSLVHRWRAALINRKLEVIQHSVFRYDPEKCETDPIYYREMCNALRTFLIYLVGCGGLDPQRIIDYHDELNRY